MGVTTKMRSTRTTTTKWTNRRELARLYWLCLISTQSNSKKGFLVSTLRIVLLFEDGGADEAEVDREERGAI